MIEIDLIGPLFDPPEAEGGDPVLLDAWHANITAEGLAARPDLLPFRVTPSRMRRVWAGDDPLAPAITVALRFEDEASAAMLLA